MSSEPVKVETSHDPVWVGRFTGPGGAPMVQLTFGHVTGHLSWSIEDAVAVASALLEARQEWLKSAARRTARATGPRGT